MDIHGSGQLAYPSHGPRNKDRRFLDFPLRHSRMAWGVLLICVYGLELIGIDALIFLLCATAPRKPSDKNLAGARTSQSGLLLAVQFHGADLAPTTLFPLRWQGRLPNCIKLLERAGIIRPSLQWGVPGSPAGLADTSSPTAHPACRQSRTRKSKELTRFVGLPITSTHEVSVE
jgi:hypothetical protein